MNRILLINTVPTDRNGITNVIFSYFCPIITEHYVLDYVSISDIPDYYYKKVKDGGGESYVIPRRARSLYRYYVSLKRLMAQNNYDAIHIHGNSHTVVIELLAAYSAKCKVRIVHAHATSSIFPLLHRILSPLFNSLCNHRLACSEKAGNWMFGSSEFVVIRNGVDTERYVFNEDNRLTVRDKLGWQDKVILAHIGDFSANKNQSFLVDVLNRLRMKNKDFCLLLIGEGELRQTVSQKVQQKGLQQSVYFTGKIPDVEKYLSAIDRILMPSFHEGLPLTLVEQQANGLMCLVSDSVSKEANITGNITYLPLEIDKWEEIIKDQNIESSQVRKQRSETSISMLKEAGYDVSGSALSLKKYYSNSIR